MTSGTGLKQATPVYNCLKDWKLIDQVKSMILGTIASNTVINIGAWVELEKMFGKSLFGLGCSHHICNWAFDILYGPST